MNGHRRISACSPNGGDNAGVRLCAQHGIIAARLDGAVVHQEGGSDRAQYAFGFIIVRDDGLFATVAARHDPGIWDSLSTFKQQIMQRGVRQHYAQGVLAWSHVLRDGRIFPSLQKQNRTHGIAQCFKFGFAQNTLPRNRVQVCHHQRQRFVGPSFAST